MRVRGEQFDLVAAGGGGASGLVSVAGEAEHPVTGLCSVCARGEFGTAFSGGGGVKDGWGRAFEDVVGAVDGAVFVDVRE